MGRLRRLYADWRAVRWLMALGGTLASMASLAGGLWGAIRGRRLLVTLTDAPEYASATPETTTAPGPVSTGAAASLPWAVPLSILILLLTLLVWARWPMRRPRNGFDRDPRRLFGQADRRWIMRVAGGRCEHRRCLGLIRCRRPIEQLDHWYPWARGGATGRRNLVGLCARCNRRKSDRVPTRLTTSRLAAARRRYLPADAMAFAMPDGTAGGADA